MDECGRFDLLKYQWVSLSTFSHIIDILNVCAAGVGISIKSSEGWGSNKAEAMWRLEQLGKLIVK